MPTPFAAWDARPRSSSGMIESPVLPGGAHYRLAMLRPHRFERRAQMNVNIAQRQQAFQLIRHFLVENGLITTAGIVVGCALALGLGFELSRQYNLPRLDLYYLVGGVLVLWVLGQLAARQPAGRAAAISPSVATRTV